MKDLNQMGAELSMALGSAIWAFAQIEKLTYEFIAKQYADSIDDLIGELSFRSRTKILRKIIKEKKPSSDKLNRVIKAINEANKLSEERNIIVHNPWKIWIDLDEKEFKTEIQKHTQPEKKLDLNQLLEFAAKANAVETKLRFSLNAL
jgi:hypothetical protein